jgi:hypothetical protein
MSIPLGVCVLAEAGANAARTVSYPRYVHEILAHAGIFYEKVAPAELEAKLPQLRVLVTVGEGGLADAVNQKLADWVSAGGAWLSVGGLCGMDDLIGASRVPVSYKNWGGGMRSLGEGYVVADAAYAKHPMLAHLNRPLHFFGGAAVEAHDATVLATAQDAHGRARNPSAPALLERKAGKGRVILIAPDLTGTVVHVQQGRGAVTRDGVPAPDGTSPVNDSVLKSDDGAVLDWLLDREPVPGADGLSIFIQPVADLWREILLRGILYLAQETQTPLPVLWLWPRQLPAIAHLSHDTDGNDEKLGHKLLEVLHAGEVNSTWCVILPGYGTELMRKIKEAGHEYATHYDAMTAGLPWSREQFERQLGELTNMFGGERPVTNKNHYLRWENDTDIWDWCARNGIGLDQTKGASKTGEAGFNFGTCHPYFPVRFDGSTIDVLELPTPTQDLFVFAPEAILEPLLAQAKKAHGVLHLLFHPAHFRHSQVADAMLMSIRRGKEEGLEWWTGRQINAWERARRTAKLSDFSDSSFTITADQELPHATVLWLGTQKLDAPGTETSGTLRAWGFEFAAVTATIKNSLRIAVR